jgi:RNA polymerase sigma-70 factor (ECF subfamily)
MVEAQAATADQRNEWTESDRNRTRSAAAGSDFAARLSHELPRLSRLALRLVRDPGRAEDLVQEAALRAWAKQGQLRENAPIGPWLNRILANLAIDRSRARRDEVDLADVEDRWRDDDYTVNPEQVLARAEQRDDLEDALARLPVGYRTVVVLHDAADMTTPAIADALDIGLPAAKQRLRRGRMMLVSALADDDPRRVASLAQPMRCWKARSRISAYLDEELPAESRRAVEEHLAECPTCPPLYASLVGLQEALGDLRDNDKVVPDDIAARITETLERLRAS